MADSATCPSRGCLKPGMLCKHSPLSGVRSLRRSGPLASSLLPSCSSPDILSSCPACRPGRTCRVEQQIEIMLSSTCIRSFRQKPVGLRRRPHCVTTCIQGRKRQDWTLGPKFELSREQAVDMQLQVVLRSSLFRKLLGGSSSVASGSK